MNQNMPPNPPGRSDEEGDSSASYDRDHDRDTDARDASQQPLLRQPAGRAAAGPGCQRAATEIQRAAAAQPQGVAVPGRHSRAAGRRGILDDQGRQFRRRQSRKAGARRKSSDPGTARQHRRSGGAGTDRSGAIRRRAGAAASAFGAGARSFRIRRWQRVRQRRARLP